MDSPIDIRQIPDAVGQILEQLDQSGFESWLVGGCVRDLCLGLVPKDYDLATSARPEQVQQLFPHSFATGLQHGTITVIWQGLAVEITTFRSESAYSDARRPDLVVFHDQVEADLARRDFTMNSLAWRPDRGLLDLHDGLEDLQQGLLRTVGDAQTRFGEDVLRILRAIRFAVTYDLTPDPDLVRAAAAHAGQLGLLSRERIVGEMMRILASPYPNQLKSFGGCGILAAASAILFGIESQDQPLCNQLSNLIQPDLPEAMRLSLFFLIAAAPDLERRELNQILRPFFRTAAGHAFQHLLMHECRVSRHIAQNGETMLYLFYLRLLLPLEHELTIRQQRRLLRLVARRSHLAGDSLPEHALAASRLLQLTFGHVPAAPPEDRLAFSIQSLLNKPLTVADLAINGRQLHLAGWPAGPAMRQILERLLSSVLNDEKSNRPAILLTRAWGFGGRQPRKVRR